MSYEKQKWTAYDPALTEEENIEAGSVGTAERFNYFEDGLEKTSLDLTNHLSSKANPHEITANQIGLGNVKNVEQASKDDFDKHVSNQTNPHKVTSEQVGAYSKNEIDQRFANEVVNSTKDQVVHGVKNFVDGAQSKGFPIAIERVATKTVLTTNTDEFTEASNVIFERTGRWILAYMLVGNKNANFAGWETLLQFPEGFHPAYYNNWGGALSNRKFRNPALAVYANANGIQVMAPTATFPAAQECVGIVAYTTDDEWPAEETLDTPEQIENNSKLSRT